MLSLDRPRIGLVEDDPIMGESLVQWLSVEGYEPAWWRTGAEAMAGLQDRAPDALICDMRLPDMSGEDVFRSAVPRLRDMPVLFITAYGDIDQAVRLIRAGADDYMTKPFDIREFLARLKHLMKRRPSETVSVLGASPAMQEIEALLRQIAPIQSSVLFTGESGVGKEVAARFLHSVSPKATQPFMAVNCGAIPAELMESELFGHEKGAFTGAHARHEGYAERAKDGVLFLDEVVELPLALQTKLLRLVQERVFHRVGGERPIEFKARLICATNADIDRAVRDGRFRQDLYYRLNVIPVHIAPLRDRKDDILPLARAFVAEHAAAFGSAVRGLTTIAEDALLAHAWPGNVRELRNRIERAVALSNGPWLGPNDLFPGQGRGRSRVRRQHRSPRPRKRQSVARSSLPRGEPAATSAPPRSGLASAVRRLFEKIKKHGLQRHAGGDRA